MPRELLDPPHPCHLTVDPYEARLEVVVFGEVLDGLPEERWHRLAQEPRIALALAPDRVTLLGVAVRRWTEVDLVGLDAEELWSGPRLHVPVLGLAAAPIGEVLLAIRGRFADGEPTADALFLRRGRDATDLAKAVGHFQLALEAGEMRAHLWLGHTLCALGQHQFAYDHLRRYTELAPHAAWAWCRLGEASAGLGRLADARAAFKQAVAAGGDDTAAAELLEALEAGVEPDLLL